MRKYIVYMLQCVDDSFYIGITSDLPMRMDDHYNGFNEGCYTYKRLPVELVYSTSFEYVLDAIAWEKRIKRWSRAKKEALITGNQESLEHAARSAYRKCIDGIRTNTFCLLRVTLRRAQGDSGPVMVSSSNHD